MSFDIFDIEDTTTGEQAAPTIIKVVGVGGGGDVFYLACRAVIIEDDVIGAGDQRLILISPKIL